MGSPPGPREGEVAGAGLHSGLVAKTSQPPRTNRYRCRRRSAVSPATVLRQGNLKSTQRSGSAMAGRAATRWPAYRIGLTSQSAWEARKGPRPLMPPDPGRTVVPVPAAFERSHLRRGAQAIAWHGAVKSTHRSPPILMNFGTPIASPCGRSRRSEPQGGGRAAEGGVLNNATIVTDCSVVVT